MTIYLNTEQAAAYLHAAFNLKISPGHLRVLRHRGRGPASVKLIGRVLYPEERLKKWAAGGGQDAG